ncbi:hypothetical protein K7X08_006418 [Anisodus acutangulus]|uniref:RRM domain-containing protein n=1 Tax=Anisodus acutangulus TaxID=402998 RepID=A0A9Q1MVF7_9SOLA|nr:hypothetical protein K7X08_006418 [Anisodus acutangulus]
MLSLGSYPRQPQCCTINHTPISQSLPLFSKIPPTHFFFTSNRETHLSIHHLPWKKRTGLCIFALKDEEKGGNNVLEMEDLDDDDDEDDDEVIIPLRNMKKWLENKPSGFGVDKVYDTSVEDKLMEEIEQSRKAQLANINKLKNNPVKPNTNKNVQQSKDVQDGLRVRLVNLPKKMNIDKDLLVAFKGVPGIANIIPVVSGNKKTRNPICKGLAYIDFKSKDEAQRFVKMFSGRSISFGKIQKQIKCEMINPGSPKSTTIQSVDEIKYAPEQEIPDLHGHLDDDFDTDFLSDSEENISTDHDVAEVEDLSARTNDYVETSEILSAESTSGDDLDVQEESDISKQKKAQAKEKKKKPKQKKEVSKLNIPGSARKLKIKEKALLTGVLSKYAQKAPS